MGKTYFVRPLVAVDKLAVEGGLIHKGIHVDEGAVPQVDVSCALECILCFLNVTEISHFKIAVI